jgi:hypothetical protein
VSWSQVRTFFNTRIAIADPSLSEWTSSFAPDVENIPQTLIDNKYHLFFDAGNSNPALGTAYEDNISVVVSLWKRGFGNPAQALQDLFDRAFCVRGNLVNPSFLVTDGGNIKSVENTGISPDQIDESNDNTLQIQLGFNVRLLYRHPNP